MGSAVSETSHTDRKVKIVSGHLRFLQLSITDGIFH